MSQPFAAAMTGSRARVVLFALLLTVPIVALPQLLKCSRSAVSKF